MSDLHQPNPPKRGAPKGNTFALRHGARTQRHGIALVSFREKYPGIHRSVMGLRQYLETLVIRQKGRLSLIDIGTIDLACRHEMTARLCLQRVARDIATDPVSEARLACWATAQRQAALERLGIDDAAVAGAHEAAEGASEPAEPGDLYQEEQVEADRDQGENSEA